MPSLDPSSHEPPSRGTNPSRSQSREANGFSAKQLALPPAENGSGTRRRSLSRSLSSPRRVDLKGVNDRQPESHDELTAHAPRRTGLSRERFAPEHEGRHQSYRGKMRRERDFSPPSPRYGGARRDDFRPSADGPPLPRPRSYDERDDRGDRGGKYFGRRDRGGRGGLSPERSPSLRRRRDEWRGRDGSLDDRAGRYSPPPPADGGYYRRRFPERSDSPYARRGREGRDDFRGRRNSSSPMEPANDDLRGRPRGGERHGGPGGKGRRYSVVARGVDRSATQDDLRKFFGRCSDVKDVYIPLHYKTKQPRGFAFIEFETEWAMVKVLKQLQGAEFLGRRLMLEEAEGEPSTAEEMRRRFQQRRQARYENGDFGPGRGDYHRPYARAGTGPSYRSSRGDRRYSRSPERRGD